VKVWKAFRYWLGFAVLFAFARVVLQATFGDDLDTGLATESLGFGVFMGGIWLAINWRNVAPAPRGEHPDRTGQVIAGITTGVMLGLLLGNLVVADDASFLEHLLVTVSIVTPACLIATLAFIQLDWPSSQTDGAPAEPTAAGEADGSA